MANSTVDPDHPILPDPFAWRLVEFTFRSDLDELDEPYIDLVFARDAVVRRLRFFRPQELEIRCGLPSSDGMCILDVRGRQLQDMRVRVANFENSRGALSFWASRVEDIPQLTATNASDASDRPGG